MNDIIIKNKICNKIIYFGINLHGHMNPPLSILSGLIKNQNIKVTIICTPEFKEKIEKIGAKFICYNFYIKNLFPQSYVNKMNTHTTFINAIYDMAYYNTYQMVEIIKDEKPDLIMFDKSAAHVKICLYYMKTQIKMGKLKMKMPPLLSLSTTFMLTEIELKKLIKKLSFFEIMSTLWELLNFIIM
jgi:UDP:flavonoid glycosyltransferase YjiC (YdhE family)